MHNANGKEVAEVHSKQFSVEYCNLNCNRSCLSSFVITLLISSLVDSGGIVASTEICNSNETFMKIKGKSRVLLGWTIKSLLFVENLFRQVR